MWEWERAAITEFRALDRNHDGFLTPNELVWADSPAGLAAFAMANPALATSSSTTSAPAVSTGASTSTSPFSKKEEKRAEKGRSTDRTAKYVFGALDKNKDGSLSSEEWKNSSSTRTSFERAKVEMTLPIKLDKFMAIYPAPSSRGRRGR
jgi:Ca2+-binding EF-hand superfamily protein